ncbi:MerR family transcriptional regulator [Brevibacterium renqingii]|uniref:MerR family transcriptional regulator n=1 Tax=Brevibacterium renqingii TaxID=2776916 RepID=UPI001AE03500|nr:MerR family transcriptional regulator [Brevibacterium renqingii]
MPETGMMHIGELAERTGLSLRTIRHYDQIGLLTPSGRSAGGFRLYTEDDHDQLMLIRRMKPLGYSLEQMGDLLRALESARGSDSSSADGANELTQFLDDAHERRDRLAQQLAAADEFIDQLNSRIVR